MTLESLGPNSRQAWLTERACRSPTHLTDTSANSRVVLNESELRLVDCNGSNRRPFKVLSTVGKSQGGTVRGHGGFKSPGASYKLDHRTISAHRSASNRGMDGCCINLDGG